MLLSTFYCWGTEPQRDSVLAQDHTDHPSSLNNILLPKTSLGIVGAKGEQNQGLNFCLLLLTHWDFVRNKQNSSVKMRTNLFLCSTLKSKWFGTVQISIWTFGCLTELLLIDTLDRSTIAFGDSKRSPKLSYSILAQCLLSCLVGMSTLQLNSPTRPSPRSWVA